MTVKSINDELVTYAIVKQRIIDGMREGKEPTQEMELWISDEIIRQAIVNAICVLTKISCVNKEAYKAGVADTESNEGGK